MDSTALNASIDALTTQVTQTEGTENSAEALLEGFSAAIKTAVTDALAADAAANDATIAAATSAITAVTARFTSSASTLGAAVAANPLPQSFGPQKTV